MVDQSVIKEWLNKADEDFWFATANLRDGSEFFAQICFHYHQAAEKYLKAFIVSKGLPCNKVHDLVNLLETCAAVDDSLRQLKADCILLNAAYIETRYPVHWPTNYSRETAEEEAVAAGNISRMIRDSLGISA